MPDFTLASQILLDAVRNGAFPAAVAEVGTADEILWDHAVGSISSGSDTRVTPIDTLFDLASLTKVLATTSLAMHAVEQEWLTLDQPVSRWIPDWRGDDREDVTIQDLLAHTSGLTAHLPYFRDHTGRSEFEHAICTMPLEYSPRTRAVYSDLGFILLGFILADSDPNGRRLDDQFHVQAEYRQWGELRYRPPMSWRRRTAPTEVDTWRGRLLVGEVHDQNAWALGGIAGHSGLFGTARSVGAFARDILAALQGETTLALPETVAAFARRTTVMNSSRALGWDTMCLTSSCGISMSTEAIGHTGFTGTSLWIDPLADTYVALLTNRVYPSRSNNRILEIRPAFHNAVMDAIATERTR